MHVIWARGQETGNYVHSPKSGLESGLASVPNFYRPGEFKYHGKKGQRGVIALNFLGEYRERERESKDVGIIITYYYYAILACDLRVMNLLWYESLKPELNVCMRVLT